MQRFIQWLRGRTPQQSIAREADQCDVGVKVKAEQKTDGDYSADSSFSWEVTDRNEIVDPGKNIPIQDQCDCEDNVRHTTRELADDPLSGTEGDIGVDPYNTARFDTARK